MVVALADQELDRLAGGFERGREVARLALELRRLAGAVADASRGQSSRSRWRCALSSCSISSVNLTYCERADSRTGLRSYMPEHSNAPLTHVRRQAEILGQSAVTTVPARWPPEEWPQT